MSSIRQPVFVLAVVAGLSLSGAAQGEEARAKSAPQTSHVEAVYKIALNGFDVGNFRYVSDVRNGGYALASDVELSLLMGAFHWKGVSKTTGSLAAASPRPGSFNFDYTSTMKEGSVRIGFAKNGVESVAIDPPVPPAPGTVPVKPEHLVDVLDPLTAVLSLTQDTGAAPCERKVQIFDGKQRFDLQLAYRRQEPIEGTTETAAVCRVKYIPIAGFRATEETANLARATGIEISFRRVANAKLFVPQKIVLPTLAGAAEITVQSVGISTPATGQVALVNE